MTEANNYQINVTAYNNTGVPTKINEICSTLLSPSTADITVDNTNPIARYSISYPQTEFNDPEGIDGDCSASTDNVDTGLTYEIRLIRPDNSVSTVNRTSTTSFRDTELSDVGEFITNCRITDDVNNSVYSANETFFVSSEDDGMGITIGEQKKQETKRDNNILVMAVGIGFIVIVSVVVIFIFSRKTLKKGKRRR